RQRRRLPAHPCPHLRPYRHRHGVHRRLRRAGPTHRSGGARARVARAAALPRSLMKRLLIVPVVLLLAGCAPASPVSSADDFELRVGALTTQNVLTLCQASGGLDTPIEEAGGAVTASDPFPAFAPAAEALASGHIDVGSSGATGVLTALAGNPDLVIVAVERNDNDSQGIVAAAGSGIESIEDLSGRTVAINEGGTGDYLLRKALDEHGMSIDDVDAVNLAPADAATAFSSGQVDAWATWDQYLVSAQ